MKLTFIPFLLAAGLVLGGPVVAQRQERQATPQVFQRLDRNGDGAISRAEVPSRLWQRLVRADRNHDGVIEVRELRSLAVRNREVLRAHRVQVGRVPFARRIAVRRWIARHRHGLRHRHTRIEV